MTTSPWYSLLKKNVYHDNTLCTEGNNIEAKYRASGTGGLPKCHRCKAL